MNLRNFIELFSDISLAKIRIVENRQGLPFTNLLSRDNCHVTQFTKAREENGTYIIKIIELDGTPSHYTAKLNMTDEQFIRILLRRILRNLRMKNVKTFNYFDQVKDSDIYIIKSEGAINGIRVEKHGEIKEDIAKWKGNEESQYVLLWDGNRRTVAKDITLEDLAEICD